MKERFPAGTRVRNYGEQYREAMIDGTATVIEVVREYPDGSCEYRGKRDKPLVPGMDPVTLWASYSTFKAQQQGTTSEQT